MSSSPNYTPSESQLVEWAAHFDKDSSVINNNNLKECKKLISELLSENSCSSKYKSSNCFRIAQARNQSEFLRIQLVQTSLNSKTLSCKTFHSSPSPFSIPIPCRETPSSDSQAVNRPSVVASGPSENERDNTCPVVVQRFLC